MLHIYVDADACPAKEEVYRVASRNGLSVTLVSNSWMRTPNESWLKLEIVGDGFDAVDNWIVEHVQTNDIVITADILLASRCLKKGSFALDSAGKQFTEDNIGPAVASRNLFEDLRAAGEIMGGPPPRQKKDRSCFLQKFEEMVQFIRRENK